MAESAVDWLLGQSPDVRRKIISAMSPGERAQLSQQIKYREDNPWVKYEGKPVLFVEEGLGETLWGKQKEVLNSVVHNQRTVVPTTHGIGKTHLAARLVAYWVSVYPPGTAKVVTTANSFKQVKNILWPHIRRLQMNHMPKLGYTNTVEWMIGNPPEAVVEGIKPPDDDEAGISGHHAPNLLLIVDEAGGIKNAFGQSLEALMTGGNTRLLVLGNPPVDDENTWFERIANSPEYNLIRVAAKDTPNFTGEDTGICKTCPHGVPPHQVAIHLTDIQWVESITRDFGVESAFYEARVEAQFPRDNSSKTLPMGWLEAARDNVLEGTQEDIIRLGVDIASDGGDEFVIAEIDGWHAKVIHSKSGSDNEDAVRVAGMIKEHIIAAEAKHLKRGVTAKVRCKIDCIGVGWGVTSFLQQWGREGVFHADIVPVNVAEKARDSVRFMNQRAEMWWNMRQLIQPTEADERTIWLDVDTKELAQLNGPTYGTDSAGRITIEKKADMKKRGMNSPDRAEALLLAAFEPRPVVNIATPVGLGQSNVWGALSNYS